MEKKRKWGDRRDGVWIKDLDGLHLIMPYLMPKRTEAEVYLQEEIDVTELLDYVNEKNKRSVSNKTTPFHLFVTAIAKTVYYRPYLNRFISGRRLYERDRISVSFVVKQKFEDSAEEFLLVMNVDPQHTLKDVSKRIVGDATKMRKEASTDVNSIMDFVGKLPRPLAKLFFAAVRFADYHGWMPKVITAGDPNFTTVLISNLGSIKCDAPYHHLNNYGTNSVLITIGEIHKAPRVDDEGKIVVRDVVNFGLTVDERIADGFYFAKSLKFIKFMVANPELLELPIEAEVNYVF